MQSIGNMVVVFFTFVLGAIVGAPITVAIVLSVADKISAFSMERAIGSFIGAAFVGAIAGGTIALVILNKMTARR
jgi:uncharacterized membrane protein